MTRPQTAAPAARPGPAMGPVRWSWLAAGMPTEKSLELHGPPAKRLLGHAAARARDDRLVVLAFGVVSVALSVLGPQMLGQRHRPHLRRRGRPAAAGRRDQGAGRRAAAGAGQRHASPTCVTR